MGAQPVDAVKHLLRHRLHLFFAEHLPAGRANAAGIENPSQLSEEQVRIGPVLRERKW